LNNGLKIKVLFEISQIDKLLDDSKPLFDLCKLKEPDFIELSASAMVLHSFYNGIENIIMLIFKHYDEKLPNSIRWHMELLEKAFIKEKDRNQIFENELQKKLEEYLKFRHFVRHSYGFQLEWERMEDLINEISIFWKNIKDNINNFLESS
jgi:uncharacterized protein (UPF0332 family)